jgi:hypothetical protein
MCRALPVLAADRRALAGRGPTIRAPTERMAPPVAFLPGAGDAAAAGAVAALLKSSRWGFDVRTSAGRGSAAEPPGVGGAAISPAGTSARPSPEAAPRQIGSSSTPAGGTWGSASAATGATLPPSARHRPVHRSAAATVIRGPWSRFWRGRSRTLYFRTAYFGCAEREATYRDLPGYNRRVVTRFWTGRVGVVGLHPGHRGLVIRRRSGRRLARCRPRSRSGGGDAAVTAGSIPTPPDRACCSERRGGSTGGASCSASVRRAP